MAKSAGRSARSTGPLAELIAWAKTIAIALGIVLVPRTVLCEPFRIPSGSMEPTLLVGDYLLVSKYAYGWSRHSAPFSPPVGSGRLFARAPERGDIVVFKKPADGRTDIIKRLVGLPGDRLQVTGGVLHINGRPVRRQDVAITPRDDGFDEPFPVSKHAETLPGGRRYLTKAYPDRPLAEDTGVYVVPQGCYFMMGDNRDNSLDSRFDPGPVKAGFARCPWNPALDRASASEFGMGYVPFENLVGRADIILWSWSADSTNGQPLNPLSHLRWSRTFKRLGAAGTAAS